MRFTAPARCRSGCKGEAPCPSETLVRYCAQLPEPDCKSGRVAHKVWRPLGRKTRLPRMRHGFPGNITNGLWEVYMRFTAPARCRSGCKGEAPCPSETVTAAAPCRRYVPSYRRCD